MLPRLLPGVRGIFTPAAKAGEGQGVPLIDEAGIGKSRIAQALFEALSSEPHTRIRYQCSSYHQDSALWPVVQQLRRATGIRSGDSPDEALDKLEALLGVAAEDTRAAAAVIAPLLGLDGEQRHGKLKLTPQAQRGVPSPLYRSEPAVRRVWPWPRSARPGGA